jgi:hypothetical protein
MAGKGLSITVLVIGFILALVLVIMFGRILNMINDSACYKGSTSGDMKTAHTWAAWGVGISSVVTALFLGLLIFVIVVKTAFPEGEALAAISA